MALTKSEIRNVVTRLEDLKLELLRLRAELLAEERATPLERRQIDHGRREIQRGQSVTLTKLRKELGV